MKTEEESAQRYFMPIALLLLIYFVEPPEAFEV